jgi:TonB family protein
MALMGATGAKTTQLGNEASVAVGLDRDQIAAVINRNQGQITYCYEQGLKDTPGIAGRVAIAFVIGGNGSVKSAQVDSTSLNAKQVEDCMVMRLKTWKFPVPEGGVDVQVKYPFKLERAG